MEDKKVQYQNGAIEGLITATEERMMREIASGWGRSNSTNTSG